MKRRDDEHVMTIVMMCDDACCLVRFEYFVRAKVLEQSARQMAAAESQNQKHAMSLQIKFGYVVFYSAVYKINRGYLQRLYTANQYTSEKRNPRNR